MNIAKMWAMTRVAFQGHILNWLWRSREHRRVVRSDVISKIIPSYFKRYLPAAAAIPERAVVNDDKNEKIFTLWLQGEENAPDLVKACFRSVRRHCKQELVVLDENSVFDYSTSSFLSITKSGNKAYSIFDFRSIGRNFAPIYYNEFAFLYHIEKELAH